MKRALKWMGIILGGLIGLILIAILALYVTTTLRLNRTYQVEPEAMTIANNAEVLERGQQLAGVLCAGCHGPDLSGGEFFEDPVMGYIDSSNLTAGTGGVGGIYGDADWVRAIRHGVTPDGRGLVAMPAGDFYYMSDEDLNAVIAYVKKVPPVDNETRPHRLSFMATLLAGLGAFGDIISAESIDHDLRPLAPAPGVTAEYGQYLVNIGGCRGCHGAELAGGKDPDPQAPPAPNLTPGGELNGWSEADFVQVMRTGVTPTGRQLSDYMPWKSFSKMSDDELQAVWLYLESLSAQETASR